MPFYPDCGKELDDGAVSCVGCGDKPELVAKAKELGARRRKVKWFLMGLLIILAVFGVLRAVEVSSMSSELLMDMEGARFYRRMPPELQRSWARERGVTVEELLRMPYNYWSSKVLVGLLSAWGGAWAIYLGYSFFRFVDKEGTR